MNNLSALRLCVTTDKLVIRAGHTGVECAFSQEADFANYH